MSATDYFSPISAGLALGRLPPRHIAISHAGDYIILANNTYVEVVGYKARKRYPAIDVRDRNGVRCVKWSPRTNDFFIGFNSNEILMYRIDQAQERYTYAMMNAMGTIHDGVFSHDGQRLAVATDNKVLVWRFVKGQSPKEDSWAIHLKDLFVDAETLPDAPEQGRAQPIRTWWPEWTSDELYVAYARSGVCLFRTGGHCMGSIKRHSPTRTALIGRAVDLHASRSSAIFARACENQIEVIDLNTTVIQHRIACPSVTPLSSTILFSPGGDCLVSATHGRVTCISFDDQKTRCQPLMNRNLPTVVSLMAINAETVLVAPIDTSITLWTKADVAAPSLRAIQAAQTSLSTEVLSSVVIGLGLILLAYLRWDDLVAYMDT